MKRTFNVIIEQDEDGYFIGNVPELPGCHTQAKSLDELRERIKEAIELYLEVNKDEHEEYFFIGIQKIEV
jgi:predicted RNase H-like HicB family nuclease